MPRQHVENTKEFWSENEAKRANKHANKRIIYWPPFWNKVYTLVGMTSPVKTSPESLMKTWHFSNNSLLILLLEIFWTHFSGKEALMGTDYPLKEPTRNITLDSTWYFLKSKVFIWFKFCSCTFYTHAINQETNDTKNI